MNQSTEPTPMPTREEIEESLRICDGCQEIPVLDFIDIGLQREDAEALVHAMDTLPLRNRQLLAAMDECEELTNELSDLQNRYAALEALLRDFPPAHKPGCAGNWTHSYATKSEEMKMAQLKCTCNLIARLQELAAGEPGRGRVDET